MSDFHRIFIAHLLANRWRSSCKPRTSGLLPYTVLLAGSAPADLMGGVPHGLMTRPQHSASRMECTLLRWRYKFERCVNVLQINRSFTWSCNLPASIPVEMRYSTLLFCLPALLSPALANTLTNPLEKANGTDPHMVYVKGNQAITT